MSRSSSGKDTRFSTLQQEFNSPSGRQNFKYFNGLWEKIYAQHGHQNIKMIAQ